MNSMDMGYEMALSNSISQWLSDNRLKIVYMFAGRWPEY
jgi:hypothetical protein